MKKLLKGENITHLLWILFAVFSSINYYNEKEYWITGIIALIGIVYAYKLIVNVKDNT